MSNTQKKAVEHSVVPATDKNGNGKVLNMPVVKTSNELAVDRLEKLERFERLKDINCRLREKQRKLNTMVANEDGVSGFKLVLESATDEIEIANTNVVKEVLGFAKTKLDEVVEASNTDVLTFEI